MASITTANRNRAADAVTARANSGSLVIYSGTMPTDANTALSGNTVLATLTMSATAFAAAATGQAAANAITSATAVATNTASFFRVFETGGTVVVFQGTVGTSGAELILNSVSIVTGGNVAVSSLTYTQAGS
jgi:glutamate synthase domain-containing protein 3